MSGPLGPTGEVDEYQRAVVVSRASTIRLVAPAGSGKTRTIVERVLWRLSHGTGAESVLLLTFDRSAAASLARRLDRTARKRGVEATAVRVSTLNAFGHRILRRRSSPPPTLLSERERVRMAEEALDALEERDSARLRALPAHVDGRLCLALFSRFKNELLEPERVDPNAVVELLLGDPRLASFLPPDEDADTVGAAVEAWIWLYRAFDRAVRGRGGLDFDDQKLRTWSALRRSPCFRAEVRDGIDEIVVDEFQDINRLDFDLIRCLAGRSSLVVAGDDDQAIYGFRGCSSTYIVDLEHRLGRRVEGHELRRNYRNPPNLLRHAGRLIRHNRNRIPKCPLATVRRRAKIEAIPCGSPTEEADAIRGWIRSVTRRATLDETAILVRTHARAAALATALADRGIPCRVLARDERYQDPVDFGPSARAVTLVTYFKAKGLQWRGVALAGCNEGSMPHERAPVEDERRLFYVGLTRATESLLVTYQHHRAAPPPSRFLGEAGLIRRWPWA